MIDECEIRLGWDFLLILVKLDFIDMHDRFMMKQLYMKDSRRYMMKVVNEEN